MELPDGERGGPGGGVRRPPRWLWDAIAVGGLVLLSAGGALAWPPAGLLIPGAALLVLAVVGARANRPRPPEEPPMR